MSGDSPIYFSADSVRKFLTWSLVNEAVEASLKAVVNSEVTAPPGASYCIQPKKTFTTTDNKSDLLITMPTFVGNYIPSDKSGSNSGGSSLACKLVTCFNGNPKRSTPLPSVLAHVLLFSHQTGKLSAIVEGTDLTTWRTVAASVVATKYLYFRRFGVGSEKKRQITVAIVGCGVQGQLHTIGFCQNFQVKQLNLYNRTESKAKALAAKVEQDFGSENQVKVRICLSAKEACQDADVICVATYSPDPLIHLDYLKTNGGVHINAVGAGDVLFTEVARNVYLRSKVYVDCCDNAVGLPVSVTAELGAVIRDGNHPAESSYTMFQSLGMAAEDACVAQALVDAMLSHKDKPMN
ncbi:hypothetical protein KR018_004180 [Drosophila ironensis]|nr:hypothetical protein KR018_004180 [Drosophila ironensis]